MADETKPTPLTLMQRLEKQPMAMELKKRFEAAEHLTSRVLSRAQGRELLEKLQRGSEGKA